LNDPTLAFAALVIINLWMSFPFFTTIILGALQSIPKELYEASEVDGANWWRQLGAITMPLIRPAVVPAVILSALTTFKLFESVWMVTKGGPFTGGRTGATEIVMVYSYNQAFQKFNFGYISAFAVILFILLFSVTIWQVRQSRLLAEGAR
jgi:arabinogalactan oligomer/maltooligosaccharide transport system permease protein